MMKMFEKLKLYQTKVPEGKAYMIWTIILSVFLISLVGVLGMAKPAFAALPPLSTKQLEEEAIYILVGKVKSVSSHEVNTDLGTDYHFTAIVEVKSIEKGLLKLELENPADSFTPPSGVPEPGKFIEVYYRQAGKRPQGWAGPGGQYSGLRTDAQVKLFLVLDEKEHLQLLEPNGWEAIPSK